MVLAARVEGSVSEAVAEERVWAKGGVLVGLGLV